MGRLIVRNQVPEYVAAKQKKFAWIIGIMLATLMFVLLVIVNSYSIITGLACLTCLIFLFFESSFGICLGCAVYPLFYKDKVQYCPGEICDKKSRQPIQKTSAAQLLVVLAFAGYMAIIISLSGDFIKVPPHNLFRKHVPAKVR
jgi:hypothetical protein